MARSSRFATVVAGEAAVMQVALRVSQQRPCMGIGRIDVDGATAEAGDQFVMPFIARDVVVAGHEIQLIGLAVAGAATLDGLLFFRQQLELQRLDDGLRNLVLQRKDVGEVAVVTLGPDLPARGPVDELRRDAHPVAGATHASLKHVTDPELAGGVAHIHMAVLESEHGVARRHPQRRHLAQVGDDVFTDAVGKIPLFLFAAVVGEGQNRNRWLVGGRGARAVSRLAGHRPCRGLDLS